MFRLHISKRRADTKGRIVTLRILKPWTEIEYLLDVSEGISTLLDTDSNLISIIVIAKDASTMLTIINNNRMLYSNYSAILNSGFENIGARGFKKYIQSDTGVNVAHSQDEVINLLVNNYDYIYPNIKQQLLV